MDEQRRAQRPAPDMDSVRETLNDRDQEIEEATEQELDDEVERAAEQEFDQDPARNPDDDQLKGIKGG